MRVLRAGFLPVSLLILLVAALVVPLPLYVERPGRAVSLASCVEVALDEATPLAGDFLLMTISVLPSSAADALVGAFDDATRVVGRHSILPPGVDPDAFFDRQRDVFADAADIAAAVGLREAGLSAAVTGDGVEVVQVVPNTPAAGVLQPGDVILRVDDTPITIESELRNAIAADGDDEPLSLEVSRGERALRFDLTPVMVDGAPILGVIPRTVNARVELPFEVDVASGAVGGPSAGLMISLTVYDLVLPDVDLAAGRVIAGTGSVDEAGRVGSIGGAGLKVLAAEQRDADVFLVPRGNYDEAVAAASPGSSMEIVAVSSFEQARRALSGSAPAGGGADRSPGTECEERGRARPARMWSQGR